MTHTCNFYAVQTIFQIHHGKVAFYPKKKKKSSLFLWRTSKYLSFNLITLEIANKCYEKKKKDSQNEIIYVHRFNILKIRLLGKILFKFQWYVFKITF